MSWYLSATGSKAAVKRQLGEQKIWDSNVDPAEQAVFNATREQLYAMIDRVPDPIASTILIIRASAAGHGAGLSNVSFSWESHAGI